MVLVKFKQCGKCHGDLLPNEDEWRCWQCGTYYYPQNAQPTCEPDFNEEDSKVDRKVSHVNVMIEAHERTFANWWVRNKEIIAFIDKGMTNQEIARRVGKIANTISKIRIELGDYRGFQGDA